MSGVPPPRRGEVDLLPAWLNPDKRFTDPPKYDGYRDTTFEERSEEERRQRAAEMQRVESSGLSPWSPSGQKPASPAPAGQTGELNQQSQQVDPAQEREFVAPPARFSPELHTPPPKALEARTKWFAQAHVELRNYFHEVEVAAMQHAARQGEMDRYLAERAMQDSDFKIGQQVESLEQSIEWTNVRDPQAVQKWDATAAKVSGVPGMEDSGLRLRAKMGDYREFVGQLDKDRAEVEKFAREQVKAEAGRWPVMSPIKGALHHMNPVNIATGYGDPKSRIMASIYDEVGKRVEGFSTKRRGMIYDKIPDEQRYRTALSGAGLSGAMDEMKTSNVDEGGVEEFGRHAGEFLGFLGGGAALKVAGRAAAALPGALKALGAGAKAEQGAVELVKVAPWFARSSKLMEGAAILGAGYAGGLAPEQKARLLENADLTEEERKTAERAGTAANALMGYLMFPAMHFAGAVGKKMTFGALDRPATRFLQTAVGMPAIGEGLEKGKHLTRNWLAGELDKDGDLKKSLDLMLITHPEVAGSIEKMVVAAAKGDGEAARAAAMEYGKQILPAAAGLGAFAGLSAIAPHYLSREMRAMTERDREAFLKGEPEQAKAVKDVLDETPVPEADAETRLREKVGSEKAEKALSGERAAETRAEGEQLAAKAPPERAERVKQEAADAAELDRMAENAKSESDARTLADLAEQKRGRSRAAAAGEEPAPLGKEGAEGRAVKAAMEQPAKRQRRAKKLIDEGELEAQAERARTEKYRAAQDELLAGSTRAAEAPAEGDVVTAPTGRKARVKKVAGEVVEMVDDAGKPMRRTAAELAQEAGELKPGKPIKAKLPYGERRARQLNSEIERGSGIAILLKAGGITTDLARRFTGVGAKDHKRPGLINEKGINNLDRLAQVLDQYNLIEPIRTGEPELNRTAQAEQWLTDALMGKKSGGNVEKALSEMDLERQERAKEQKESEAEQDKLDAAEVEAERLAEREAIRAESLEGKLDAETVRKTRPADEAERVDAEERQAKLLAEDRAEQARLDRLAREHMHATDPLAPPPGESVASAATRKVLDVANAIQKSGVLAAMEASKDWSKLESPADRDALAFLNYAKSRGHRGKLENVFYEWLTILEGKIPSESVKGLADQLMAEMDEIANLPSSKRPEAVAAFMERHRLTLSGAALPALRLHSLSTLNKIEALLEMDAGEFGGVSAAAVGGAARAAVAFGMRTVRAMWPWSSPQGLVGYSFSPAAHAQLLDVLNREILKDPDVEVHTLKQNVFRTLGIEHPESWSGRVGHDMALAANEVITESRNILRSLISKKFGMLREIVGHGAEKAAARERLFDALNNKGPNSPEWGKLSAKEAVWATEVRAVMEDFRVKLVDSGPRMAHLRRELDLVGQQEIAHRNAAAAAKNGGLRAFHVKRAADAVARAEAINTEIQRYGEKWGIREFIHHVRAEAETSLEHFQRRDWLHGNKIHTAPNQVGSTVVAERTGKLEASGELLHDVVASLVDYLPKAISYTRRNQVLGRYHEFLHGRESPATWADMVTPDKEATVHYRNRDYQALGEVYVAKDGTLSPTAADGVMLVARKGAVRRLLLLDYHDRQSAFVRSPAAKPTLRDAENSIARDAKNVVEIAKRLNEASPRKAATMVREMRRNQIPVDGNFRLLAPKDLIDITVRKGGWFARASPKRLADMTALLERFGGGMRQLQMSPFNVGNIFAKMGRTASYLKLVGNIPAAANVVFSAMFVNSISMTLPQLTAATGHAFEFYARYARSRNQPLDAAALARESGFTFGRAKMRSSKDQLDRTSAKELPDRLILDEAYETLFKHPLFESKFVDLAKRLFTPDGKGPRSAAANQLRALFGKAPRTEGQQFWELQNKFTGMEHIAAADHFARTVNYLGNFVSLRKAGRSRAEANRIATADVVRNHGVFNSVTRSKLMGSSFGQFAFGLQTYVMRQFDLWTRMPWEYKVKYASLALGTNYLWRSLGWGDLTGQLGFSAWDIPLIGQAAEILALGDDEKGREDHLQHPGFVPVPIGVQGGPGMQFIGQGIQGIERMAKGQPVTRHMVRAFATMFQPAVLDQWQRAFGTRKSDAGWEYTPWLQDWAGSERTSYTLKKQGIAQYLADLRPGTQMEVAKEQEMAAIVRGTEARVKGRRESIYEDARSTLRLHDEAQNSGQMTDTMREASTAKWRELRAQGAKFGLDVRDRRDEMRDRTRTEHLPPSMRAVLSAGTKEAKVRTLTRLIEEGMSRSQLGQLGKELRGEKSLMDWALDGETVSLETRKAFHGAVQRWRQQTKQP